MSKKSILNITSRKKRNVMLNYSNTTSSGASSSIGINPLYVGSAGATVLWSPTCQDLLDGSGAIGTVGEVAARTATTCYMRGLSEHLRIQTSSGLPWFWRRICFTTKGDSFYSQIAGDSPINGIQPYLDTSAGMQRYSMNQTINNMTNTIASQQGIIFKGARGIDWNDALIAPLDHARITVKYDKTITIRSGNTNGTVLEKKLWHPMNANLTYDDDEKGDAETTSYYSTDSKQGMGDYYIYDVIQPGSGAGSTDVILFAINSSLYWHEK